MARLRQLGHFEIPQDVHEATKDFKSYNDIPAQFVSECCVTGPDFKTQSMLLYRAYQDWCNETGNKPESITKIAMEWKRLGFTKYPANGRNWWRGVGLSDATKE